MRGLCRRADLAVCWRRRAAAVPAAPTPPPTGPVVSSISPNTGPSIGGTAVTINGQRFDATRNGHDRGRRSEERHLRQRQHADGDDRTAEHRRRRRRRDGRGAAGGAGRTGSPTRHRAVTNAPPVISSLRAVGSGPNEPAGYRRHERGAAPSRPSVTDAETPVSDLTFEWTADAGTFSGTGPSVKWKAPAVFGSPVTAKITRDGHGAVHRDRRHREPCSERAQGVGRDERVGARLGEGKRRDGDGISHRFLELVGQPRGRCAVFLRRVPRHGRTSWRTSRTTAPRTLITAHKLGSPGVTINFGGACAFESTAGDACISLSCEFTSTVKATGRQAVARGTCYLTSVYRDSKWQLCDSNYDGRKWHRERVHAVDGAACVRQATERT